MYKLHYIILLLAMLISTKNVKAQIPVNDPGWVKDTTLSDDFHGTVLNSSKWYIQTDSTPGKGLEMMFHRNVKISGDSLTIFADTLNPNRTFYGKTYKYQSGTVISNGNGMFKYGYIEISARFPTGHRLYWPALWVERDSCTTTSAAWHNEIDICEYANDAALNGHIFGSNWHIYDSLPTYCPSDPPGTDNYVEAPVSPLLSSGFHKYALQWDEGVMNFYFDDNLIRTVPDTSLAFPTPKHGLNAILDFYITPWITEALPHMPRAHFAIDYFYYYKLVGDCNANLTINAPGDYNRKVKKQLQPILPILLLLTPAINIL